MQSKRLYITSDDSGDFFKKGLMFRWELIHLWGEGLLQSRKPQTPEEYLSYFTSWVYICATLNATTLASIPLRLYVAKEKRGRKYLLIQTKKIDNARLKFLSSNNSLHKYLRKAKEVEEVTDP